MKLFLLILGLISVAAGVLACATVAPAPYIASENSREALTDASKVEVRYIANEGVLITSSDKRVLIDGLHRKYRDAYAYLPDQERDKMESARTPFDKIDLILVSHMHGDHFHPESVGRYLTSHKTASLATSQQVVDEVAGKFAGFEALRDRVTPIAFKLLDRTTKRVGGVDVEFLSIGHGTGRHETIQNLGHVFVLGGKKFLHIGDAPTDAAIFDHFDLDKAQIDIAFLPAWFLTSDPGRAIIRDHIKPKHVIAVHVGPGEGESLKQQIKKDFPAADVFSTMLEKKVF